MNMLDVGQKACLALLRATPLFGRIGSDADLYQLQRRACLRSVAAGTPLIAQDAPVEEIDLICSGEVAVSFSGGAVESLHLGMGSLFGEMEYFDPSPGLATVIATEPTRVLAIRHADLRRIAADNPLTGMQLYYGFLTTMVAKHRLVTDSLVQWKLDKSREHLAHDLSTPIAALRTLEDAATRLTAAEHEIFTLALARMDGIVTGLSPRLRCGRDELIVQLRQLLRQLQLLQASEPHIRLGWRGPVALRQPLSSDQVPELVRIVANLLENGREALLPNFGRLSLRVQESVSSLQIDVIDDGPGISIALRRRLGRVPVSFGKTQGKGLALFHARRTLERWGGSLQVASRPGHGCRVRLRLPLGPVSGHPDPSRNWVHVHREGNGLATTATDVLVPPGASMQFRR